MKRQRTVWVFQNTGTGDFMVFGSKKKAIAYYENQRDEYAEEIEERGAEEYVSDTSRSAYLRDGDVLKVHKEFVW